MSGRLDLRNNKPYTLLKLFILNYSDRSNSTGLATAALIARKLTV